MARGGRMVGRGGTTVGDDATVRLSLYNRENGGILLLLGAKESKWVDL